MKQTESSLDEKIRRLEEKYKELDDSFAPLYIGGVIAVIGAVAGYYCFNDQGFVPKFCGAATGAIVGMVCGVTGMVTTFDEALKPDLYHRIAYLKHLKDEKISNNHQKKSVPLNMPNL